MWCTHVQFTTCTHVPFMWWTAASMWWTANRGQKKGIPGCPVASIGPRKLADQPFFFERIQCRFDSPTRASHMLCELLVGRRKTPLMVSCCRALEVSQSAVNGIRIDAQLAGLGSSITGLPSVWTFVFWVLRTWIPCPQLYMVSCSFNLGSSSVVKLWSMKRTLFVGWIVSRPLSSWTKINSLSCSGASDQPSCK